MDLLEALQRYRKSKGQDEIAKMHIDMSCFTGNFHCYSIKKSNGRFRKIAAPDDETKEIQRELNELFQEEWFYNKANLKQVFSFQRGKNTKQNAQHHVKKDVVLKLDLKDYFETITPEHMTEHSLWPNTLETLVRRVCFLRGSLPQGAPTSPTIANWIVGSIIVPLVNQILIELGITAEVTAYADDVTISGGEELVPAYMTIIQHIESNTTFKFNRKKSKWIRKNNRQEICGIVCNEKANIPKKKIQEFRGLVHKSKILNLTGDMIGLSQNDQKVKGMFNYIHGIDENKAAKLMAYRDRKYKEWEIDFKNA